MMWNGSTRGLSMKRQPEHFFFAVWMTDFIRILCFWGLPCSIIVLMFGDFRDPSQVYRRYYIGVNRSL